MAAPNVLDRLRKICGMMGSAHEGERAAAVSRANELLAKHKLTWADVIGGAPAPAMRPPDEPAIDLDVIPEALMSSGALRAYAAIFLKEHEQEFYDLGDTTFMRDVMNKPRWSYRQRDGFVRSLRRAWMIRHNAGW